jgi:hypothetical protein
MSTATRASGAAKCGSGSPTFGPSLPRAGFGSELSATTAIAITAATPTTQV